MCSMSNVYFSIRLHDLLEKNAKFLTTLSEDNCLLKVFTKYLKKYQDSSF